MIFKESKVKKAVLFILALVISISTFAAKYPAVKPEGEGTQESPYLFKQIENFGWIADQRDKIDAGTTVYCVQINDIDATETENWFFPEIMTNNINGEKRGSWTLNYDGQGFNIENVCVGSQGYYNALFAVGNFQLKNINIVRAKNKVFNGYTIPCHGILVGIMGSGYIKNCHIRETKMLACAALADQLVGSDVEISDCSVDVELASALAGLICFVRNYGTVVIKNTSVKAKITLNNDDACDLASAGFIRALQLEEGSKKTVIEDCYADVEISIPNPYVGLSGFIGIINNLRYGEQIDFSINRCYSTGTICNTKPWQSASFLSEVNDCEPIINDCYYNANSLLKADKYALPKTEDELKQQATFENWDFENVWAIDEGNGFPYLRKAEVEKRYPKLFVNYNGTGKCSVNNGVVTIEGGSDKDTLAISGLLGNRCQVKNIVTEHGLKKIKVTGDLEGMQVAGKVGALLVNRGNLGKEGKDFALIFDADNAVIKVKGEKGNIAKGSKAAGTIIGGDIKGNILCGTRDEAGNITTLGTVKKMATLGGNIENGKVVAERVGKVTAKPKGGKGGQIIDFKTETN